VTFAHGARSSQHLRDAKYAPRMALLRRLVERHGEAVGMEDLRRHAWPVGGGSDQHLRHRMRTLRKILGGMPGDQS